MLLSCDCFVAHPSYRPDYTRTVSPFDVAVIELDRYLDVTQTQPCIGVLKPFPSSMDHQEGLAIGKNRRNSNIDIEVLMGIKLSRFPQCETHFRRHRMDFDGNKQICFKTDGAIWPVDGEGAFGGPIVTLSSEIGCVCLIGIASYFPNDLSHDSTALNVFTRANYFSSWTENIIKRLSSTSRRKCCVVLK